MRKKSVMTAEECFWQESMSSCARSVKRKGKVMAERRVRGGENLRGIKLKSCPFCGCHDRRVGIRRMGNKGYRIVCGQCGACGPYVSISSAGEDKMFAQNKARAEWNRREDEQNESS